MKTNYRYKVLLNVVFFAFFIVTGCKKSDSQPIQVEKEYAAITKSITESSGIVAKIFSDTTFTVSEGVEETDIHFLNKNGYSTKVFILKIDLKNPNLSLKVGTPYNSTAYSKQTVTDMAKYVDAPSNRVIAGINSDFYHTGTLVPIGILYKDGVGIKTAFSDNTGRIDQGLSFFGILKNGTAVIGNNTTDYTALSSQLQDATGGGVFLVKDSKEVSTTFNTVEPRTAIGVTENQEVYFVVVDGRNFYYSNGINYEQLSKLFVSLNVKDAINLDGGGSSTFVIKNPLAPVWQVRNRPSDGSPRAVANSWLLVANQP